jgi:hypothetical protein
MSRRTLQYLDRARILDPVAHLVPIQTAVRNRGREMIKTGVKERQIHDEIDR